MKTKISLSLIAMLMIASQSFSQMSCDDVKKQNLLLQGKLKQFGIDVVDSVTKVSSYSSDINVNFIKCVGDKQSQTVTVYFNLTNPSLPNQTVKLNFDYYNSKSNSTSKTQASDEIGAGYSPIKATFGSTIDNYFTSTYSSKLNSKLSTGAAPILGSITFANILPNVAKFSNVDICFSSQNLLGEGNERAGIAEIRNVKIAWK